MVWDNTTGATKIVGVVETAAGLNRWISNMKQLKGENAGQTEILLKALLSVVGHFEGSGSTFDLRKRFTGGASGVAEVTLLAQDAAAPSVITTGDGCALQGSLGVVGGAEEALGEVRWTRENEGSGSVRLSGLGSVASVDVHVTPEGLVGFETEDPEYDLDLGAKSLNATEYRLNGATMPDWTETTGTPNRLDWTGNALVSGSFRSTAASGAPLSVASATQVANLNAERLDGYSWHAGLLALDEENYWAIGTSDTDTVTLDLDRPGNWLLFGLAAITVEGDEGNEFRVRLKQGATQIGETAEFTPISDFEAFSVLAVGEYSSASGSETVKVTVAKAAGSGSSYSSPTTLVAIWQGP